MSHPTVLHSTFVVERSYSATPERVFAAFADPQQKRRWFAEGDDFEVEAFTMDFRVGGSEQGRFRVTGESPAKGKSFVNNTTYQDIVPNRRIVFAYTMAVEDQRMSASLATIELLPAEKGCTLVFTEQGAFFESADGPQMREKGWRQLLDSLARELET